MNSASTSTIAGPSTWPADGQQCQDVGGVGAGAQSDRGTSTISLRAPSTPGIYTYTLNYNVTRGSNTVAQELATSTLQVQFTLTVQQNDTVAPTTTPSATVPNGPGTSPYNAGGWTNKNVTLSLSATDTGGSDLKEICYTTNGTDPSASSQLYTGPLTLSSTTTVKYRAYDNAGNAEAIKTFQANIDKTNPTVGTATAVKLDFSGNPAGDYNAGDWTNKDVKVNWTCTDTGGSGVVKASDNQTVTSEGAAGSVTPSCADQAGNTASGPAFSPIKIDKTNPTLHLPDDITEEAPGPDGAAATFNTTADDNLDANPQVDCSPNSGSTFQVGTTTVTCMATDAHGNKATKSFTVTVNYNWTGFFSPVDNPTTTSLGWNSAKAGQSIPMKFRLSGFQGYSVISGGNPKVTQVACPNSSTPLDLIEEYATTANNGLTYDSTADQYNYVWKTQSTYANKCFKVDMVLTDGTHHEAYFKFTK